MNFFSHENYHFASKIFAPKFSRKWEILQAFSRKIVNIFAKIRKFNEFLFAEVGIFDSTLKSGQSDENGGDF